MPGLVQLGDVPEWIGVAQTAAIAVWGGISQHQKRQALDFVEIVKSVSELSDERLRELIEADPRLAELVNRTWHSASLTADDGKRRLLAYVVVRAIAGHLDDAVIEDAPFLARAIEQLDPVHIEILALIARPKAFPGWTPAELVSAAPRYGDLLGPTLSTLSREGLIENAGARTYGGGEAWKLTRFGWRLITYLPDGGFPVPEMDEAHLIARSTSVPPQVVLTNVGLGVARQVVVHGLEAHHATASGPKDLEYDMFTTVEFHGSAEGGASEAVASPITVSWKDGKGERAADLDSLSELRSHPPRDAGQ